MEDQFSIDTVEQMWNAVHEPDEKLDILFRIMLDTGKRVQKIEKRKRFDRACSTVAGFFGGIVGSFFLKPRL